MAISAWLATLPLWLSASLVVGSFVLFAVVVILAMRRMIPPSALEPHNDVASFVGNSVGVIYGVMLAFVVASVWTEYGAAGDLAAHESTEAFALYRDLSVYPNRAEAEMGLAALRVYTLSMVHDEFPAMKAMKWDYRTPAYLPANKAAGELWTAIRQIVPRNLHEQSLFNEILKHADNLAQDRVKLRLIAQSDLPGVLWVVVVLGGFITLGITAMMGHENVRQHVSLAVLLALVIGGAIHVIVSLNFPFTGVFCINPDGYNYLIEQAGW